MDLQIKKEPLFSGISEFSYRQIFQDMRLRRFKPDQIIFREGDPGSFLYFVKSGRVRIYVHSKQGSEVSIILYGHEGDLFGELAVIDGLPRSATAVALVPTQLYVLNHEDFYKHMHRCSEFAFNVMRDLSRRLRYNTEHVTNLTSLGIPQRLAGKLIELAYEYGRSGKDGIFITIPLTQDDLASFIGATRESINRNLRTFQKAAWIHIQHKHITVLDPDSLRTQFLS